MRPHLLRVSSSYREGPAISPVTLIILAIVVLGLVFACLSMALGRAARKADRDSERWVLEAKNRAVANLPEEDYAGLALAQATISAEPSTMLPSSSTSVGTIELPVRRFTS